MQTVANGYRGLGLLFDVNNDRMIAVLIVTAALAAVGWVGVEYAQSLMVDNSPAAGATYL